VNTIIIVGILEEPMDANMFQASATGHAVRTLKSTESMALSHESDETPCLLNKVACIHLLIGTEQQAWYSFSLTN
jgi:hypothetical protein